MRAWLPTKDHQLEGCRLKGTTRTTSGGVGTIETSVSRSGFPARLTPLFLLELQRQYGNSYVQRVVATAKGSTPTIASPLERKLQRQDDGGLPDATTDNSNQTATDAGIDAGSQQGDCTQALADQVDLVEAAAVNFMRKILKRTDPVPNSIQDCSPPTMPYTCDVTFSNGMVLEVEVSADHLRVFVSQADKEPTTIAHPVCTFLYKCLPNGGFSFQWTECTS